MLICKVNKIMLTMAKKTYIQEEQMPTNVGEPTLAYRAEVSSTRLNPAQLHLLKMFSNIKSEKTFQDLKIVLDEFLIQQIEKESNKFWEEGKISYELLNEHLRTPYQ